jgi:photosystem II stability/assembly factor-like uncharacterized protein
MQTLPFRDPKADLRERIHTLEQDLAALRRELGPSPARPRRRAWLLALPAAVALATLGGTFVAHRHARLPAISASAPATSTYAWKAEPTPAEAPLRAVWARGPLAFAVGDKGTIVFRSPSGSWTRQESGTTEDLTAIGGEPLFAVGKHGTILWFDAGTKRWTREQAPVDVDLLGVASWYGRTIVVGAKGTILTRRDGAWVRLESGTDADLHAVWYVPEGWGEPREAYVVGDRGTILVARAPWRELFTRFTEAQSGTSENLVAIAGDDHTILAVGDHRALLRSAPHSYAPWSQEKGNFALPGFRAVVMGIGADGQPSSLALGADGTLALAGRRGAWHAEAAPSGAYVGLAALEGSGEASELLALAAGGREILHGAVR